MSPANPAGDFLAAHAIASQGDPVANLDALLPGGGQTASMTPAPAAPPAAGGGAPATPSPIVGGGEVQAPVQRPLGQKLLDVLGQLKDRFTGDIAGSFEQLKADWLKQHQLSDEAAKQPFWQSLKTTFEGQLQTGKTAVDAFGAIMSPISAAFDTGNHAVAKAVQAAAGLDDQQTERLAQDLGSSEIGLGPKGGLKGAMAKIPAPAGSPSSGAAAPATSPVNGGGPPPAPPVEHDVMFLGRESLRATAEDKNRAAAYLKGQIPDNPVQASLDTLSDANGARDAVTKVAKFIPEGEVKSDDVLRSAAFTLQRSPDEILSGLKTALPTDEEILSWKMLMEAGGSQLKQAADAYIADSTPEKFEAAARAYALATRMVENWDQVGTEQARAFRARQLAAEATPEQTKSVMDILRGVGPDNLEEVIRKAAALQDPAKIPPWIALVKRLTSRDSIVTGWTNLLLSNVPKTLSKKLFGDAFAAAWQLSTRGAAEAVGGVDRGTTYQTLYGYWGSLADGVRAAGKALRQGGSQFHSEYQTVEGLQKQRLGELAKGMAKSDEPTAAAIALLRAAMPTTWIGAADDFAKVIHYRAELRRLAYDAAEGDAAKISELMDNPPPAIHEQALAYALKNTYQEPLAGAAQAAQQLIDKSDLPVGGTGVSVPFGRFLVPFIKVPMNLYKYAWQASPAQVLGPAFWNDLSAGGSRRALAVARVTLGSAIAGIAATMSYQDRLTGMGPSEPDERRFWLATHQPYSLKLGNTWYGFQGAHPLGMILGVIGDTTDVFRYAHERDAEDAAASIIFGIAHAAVAPTFMLGASDFLEALNDPSADGRRYLENLIPSMTPVSTQGPLAADNALDEWRRAHYNMLDAIRARTPGLSKDLPPVRTIWGDPLPRAHGWAPWGDAGALGRAFSPVPMRGEDELAQPIDKWIWANRAAFPHDEDQGRLGLSPPGQIQTYSTDKISAQVQLNAQQLDRLRVLAGNGIKEPVSGLGAKDALNALVSGKFPDARTQAQWNAASPELKAQKVQSLWAAYRDAAKKQLLADDAGLRGQVMQLMTARQKALAAPSAAPTFGGP